MKVKNLAFFGIMASILGVSAANAAPVEGNAILTSKAYVDRELGTKQDTITTNSLSGSYLLDSSVSAAKLDSDVNAALTKAGTALQSANLAGYATEDYVGTEIGKLDAEVNATDNKVVTGVVETDGKITAVNAALITSANIASNANIAATQLSTAVQSALTAAGTAVQPGALGELASKDEVTGADIAANANIAATQLSTAVQSALTAAGTALQSVPSEYATETEVGTAIDTKIGTLDAEINKTDGTVLTGVTEADGKITAVASTKIANANVATDANIAYTKMAAPTIDVDGTNVDCQANRCVLTYHNGAYSLTPMSATIAQ